jgi:hypothetical protein
MKIKGFFLGFIFSLMSFYAMAQKPVLPITGKNDTIKVALTDVDGMLVPWVVLNEVSVVDRRIFRSPEDLAKYRRLKYNVLKVLPYARFAGQRYRQLEKDLALTSNKRKQKELVKGCEKEIKDLFNREIKNMTITQGGILIKLIDRETGNSSFDHLKETKGRVPAFFLQSVAKMFGHDLKAKYDVEQERDIEAIILASGYYTYQ